MDRKATRNGMNFVKLTGMHYSQQDQKNRVYKREIEVSRLYDWQQTRFLMLVQDLSKEGRRKKQQRQYRTRKGATRAKSRIFTFHYIV